MSKKYIIEIIAHYENDYTTTGFYRNINKDFEIDFVSDINKATIIDEDNLDALLNWMCCVIYDNYSNYVDFRYLEITDFNGKITLKTGI